MQRAAILTRLWSAYPSAGRCTESMLIEYVNATRGLELEHLGRCVDAAIARGGEFIPSAGDVVTRAAEYLAGGPPSGDDKDAWFRFRNAVKTRVEQVAKLNAHTEPLRQVTAPAEKRTLARLAEGLRLLPEGA
jgi:hypothetical protein